MEAYAESAGLKKIQVTTLPKATEAGNPDFRVWDGKQRIVGYIEAKAPKFFKQKRHLHVSYGVRGHHKLEGVEAFEDVLDGAAAKFQGKGDDIVDRLGYDEKEERLYINKTQYFEKVPREVYEYHIGGYRVCNKWLKDRKDRRLSLDDTKHYCKVVSALQKTIELQKAVDEIYPQAEKGIVEFPK